MNEKATQIANHIHSAIRETVENEVYSLSIKELNNLISEYLLLQSKYKLSVEAEMILEIASNELKYRDYRLTVKTK
jgi:hypothetical protein